MKISWYLHINGIILGGDIIYMRFFFKTYMHDMFQQLLLKPHIRDINNILFCSICEWKVLQGPEAYYSRWLFLSRAWRSQKHLKSSWVKCNSYKCGQISWPQHFRDSLGSCWLCTIWPKSSPHSPSCNWDSNSHRGYSFSWLCYIQSR